MKNNNNFDIEKMIKKYSNYVYKIINNTVTEQVTIEDKEEIISDVFFILWQNQNIIDKNKDIKAYIAGITKNVIKIKLKKVKKTSKAECDIDDFQNFLHTEKSTESILEKNEDFEQLVQEIKRLESDEYEMLINYYYKGKKIKEIANEFKISESKVKVTLYRIRKKLKKILKKRGM